MGGWTRRLAGIAVICFAPWALIASPVERTVYRARGLSEYDFVRLQVAAAQTPNAVVLWDGPKSTPGNARLIEQLGRCRVETVDTTACVNLIDRCTAKLTTPSSSRDALIRSAFSQPSNLDFKTIVVTNPADPLSVLAPTIAAKTGGLLVFTDERGDVEAAVRDLGDHSADSLVLLGSPKHLPMGRRDNPIAGKDEFIEMEPFTPAEPNLPVTYSVGRLFHDDPGIVLQVLARSQLLPPNGARRNALVASNPGGGLPLLEAFSRTSAKELSRRGFETTTMFGREVSPAELRRQWPKHDLVLWEGHHNTLMFDYGFPSWSEPLPPALVIMQSCIALQEPKVMPLLERGSLAIVGSSSRIYSGTGGAFSLAYINALTYDQQTIGGALRHGKNFLIAYTMLKDKKFNGNARLNGANMRSAWAFSLWGDPTIKFTTPPPQDGDAVRAKIRGDIITIHVPASMTSKVIPGRYDVPDRPNGRLAGLMHNSDEAKELSSMVFAELPLPKMPAGSVPKLSGKSAEKAVLLWDSRRNVGYVLASAPSKDEHELRFRVVAEARP